MPGGEAQANANMRYKERMRDSRKMPYIEESKLIKIREKYRYNLEGFLLNCMPRTFNMPFADCHREVIKGLQHAVLHGGNKAVALPRGTGKTSIAIGATIWAILYGHVRFGAVVAADQDAANKILQSIKTELWLSDGIGKLWPYLQSYLATGDGDGNKYRHILNDDGSPPLIKWGANVLKLPSVPEEYKCEWSGAVIQCKGLTSGVRGMQYKLPDGTTLRPSLALIDDPQTKDSARSQSQTDTREEIVEADIMGLAGPDKAISAFMLCTPIEPNDMAMRYLDNKIHGDWNGTHVPMIIKFPDAVDTLWEEYRILYMKALQGGEIPDKAYDYYLENRDAMDLGGIVYWEARKQDTEHSALQSAMNLRFKRGNAFLTEYQCEPVYRNAGKPYQIDEIQVMEKCNGFNRLFLPKDCKIIVTGTDINYSGLNTTVVGSTNDAVRYIADYQTFPGNGKDLYDPSRRKKSDSDLAAIARALDEHIPAIASARYMRDGKLVPPDLILIDCGNWMDLVFRWCQMNRAKLGGMVFPSRGRSASKYRPSQLVGQPGDGWHVADWKNRGRVLVHNSDAWRMRTQQAFIVPNAVPGSVSLFGKLPHTHKTFADEICAEILDEYIEETDGGNVFYKWTNKVGVRNDKLDSTTMAFAGLSYMGASENKLSQVRVHKQPKNRRRGRKVTKIKV
jgi:hypothetical protein